MRYFKSMNRWEKSVWAGVSGLLLAASAHAETTTTRSYRSIVDRNPFGLKDPVVQTNTPTDTLESQRVKVNLTGITRIGNTKQVHLMIPPDGKNPPRYLSLAENDKDGAIEVLEINVEKETVRIRNAGSEANLNFLNDGLKTAAVAAPAVPGATPGKPMAMAPGGAPPGGAGSGPTIVNRGGQVSSQPNQNFANPLGAQPGVMDNNNTSLRTIPTRNVRTQPNPAPEQVNYPDQGENIAAQQAINMEIQRNQPTPDNVPLPPTPGLDGE
jgi:hypothetical protein